MTGNSSSNERDEPASRHRIESDGTAGQRDETPALAEREATEAGLASRSATHPPPTKAGGDGTAEPPTPPSSTGPERLHERTNDIDFRVALAQSIGGCRSALIAVGVFSFVINVLILAIPIYLFQISDRVLSSRSVETLIMLTTVVVGALAVYAALDMVRRYVLMRVAVHMETTLSGPVLSAAAKSAQFGSTREFQTLHDIQQIRHFLTGPVILSMYDAPVAPIYFLAIFIIHPHLGIIITVAALILVSLALINQQLTAVPYARANAFATRANLQAEAVARNAQVVNAMGMIREAVFVWGRELAESLKAQVDAQDRNVLMTAISKFLRLLTQVALLGWGAYLALHGELTGGMMIAASIIGSRALAPVEGVIEGWRSYAHARGAYSRVRSLLQASPLNAERLILPRPEGRLEVDRVLYVPPPTKKVVLNGINFVLEPGESLAIVGPSGTGKSTLARMLVGSIAPTSGSVRLDFMDIRNWDPRQFGETVGYLPQDVELFPATIKANIARLREDVSDASIFDAAELAGVHEMISELPQGYETVIGMDGSPLSGGQKQRIGLARAFFGNPRLVVLDEPNSNLDTNGEAALAAALVRAKRRGVTVVAVTQRPALLRSVDKILLMKDGRIQMIGARDEVLAKIAQAGRAGAGASGAVESMAS